LLTRSDDVVLMLCEMCGKRVTFCKKVMIEEVPLQVCSECAKFGMEQTKKQEEQPQGPKPVIAQRLEVREKRAKPRDVLENVEKEELVDDFPARIRNARSKLGLSQKDLAMKMNERVGLLQKIETGNMRPDEKLIAKLQKELSIVLKEKVATVAVSKATAQRTQTLADLIRVDKD